MVYSLKTTMFEDSILPAPHTPAVDLSEDDDVTPAAVDLSDDDDVTPAAVDLYAMPLEDGEAQRQRTPYRRQLLYTCRSS